MSIFGIRETHSLQDWRVHEQDHKARGTVLISGGDFSSWVAGSTLSADRRPDISEAVLMDEDLQTTLPALTTGLYSWAKIRRTTTTPRFCIQTDNADIVERTGNAPHYNYISGSDWTDAPLSANDYAVMFVMAIPVTDDTESQKYRFIFIMPQHRGTLSSMQAVNVGSLQLADVRESVPEFNFIARIILRYTASNWTITQIDKLTGSLTQQVTVPAGNYLSVVAVDGVTITGNGTPGSPLVGAGGSDPSEGGTKLKRVDNGAYEVPRTSSGNITAAAQSGGTKVTITSAAHGQPEGGTVTISGTTDYNGTFVISNVTENTFDIIDTWNVTRTGTWTAENVYYAPQPYALYGTKARAKRVNFSGFSGEVPVATGVSKPLGVIGYCYDNQIDVSTTSGFANLGYTWSLVVRPGGVLNINRGVEFDDTTDTGSVIAFYLVP